MEDLSEKKEEDIYVNYEAIEKTPEFYYPPGYKPKNPRDTDIPSSYLKFQSLFGMDSKKRYNINFLNDHEIIYVNSNTFQILNLTTMVRRIFHGTENGGIGCVCVHPSKKFFAVGECGDYPNIYIYEYPSLKLYRILRRGTDKAYACLSFNAKGDQLASVGSEPDYNLVIWNWMKEIIILKSKAFSQEILGVHFSTNFEERLITSGIGHIKFWQMAQTFTGLKLQGELGKFGQIDLSDISSFLEFPDGKVISGTEYGTMLVWEGIFIKTQIFISQEEACHKGFIDYMAWEGNNLVTGGSDGYIKWWSNESIENADINDDSKSFVKPLQKKLLMNKIINQPVKIINIVKNEKFWIVQDSSGYIFKCHPEKEYELDLIFDFHSGSVRRIYHVKSSQYLFSQGSDTKSVLYDISKAGIKDKIIIHQEKTRILPPELETLNEQGEKLLTVTCADFFGRDFDNEQLVIAMGFNTGLYNIMEYNASASKLDLLSQFKAHDEEIKNIKFSKDGSYIITQTKKEIFFFLIENFEKIFPISYITLSSEISDCDWNYDSKKILVGLHNGNLEEIVVPLKFDNFQSYHNTNFESTSFTIKLSEGQLEKDENKNRTQKQKKKKVEPGPAPILSCKYINSDGDILVTAAKPYNEFLYRVRINENRPLGYWNLGNKSDSFIKFHSDNFLILTNTHGSVQIRPKSDPARLVEYFPNSQSQLIDVTMGGDEKLISACFKDGSIISHFVDSNGIFQFLKTSNENPVKNFELPEIKPDILSQIPTTRQQEEAEKNKLLLLSLEKEKRKAEELARLKKSEEKKNDLRRQVNVLKEKFNTVNEKNKRLEELKLNPDEMIVDEKYLDDIKAIHQQNMVDIKHKYDWKKEQVRVPIEKINEFFIDSVKTPKIYVIGFESKEFVTTLRCPSLPNDFEEEKLQMKIIFYDNIKKIDFSSLEESFKQYMMDEGSNKHDEDQKAGAIFERIMNRLNNKGEDSSVKKAEYIKNEIKDEIELNSTDIVEVDAVLKNREHIREKISNKSGKKELKLRQRKDTEFKNDGHRREDIIRCPEAYSLKLDNENYYDESKMRTTLSHKMIIYNFLKELYEENQKFNEEVLNLRDRKTEIIRKLKENKTKLQKLCSLVGNEKEKIDLTWLDQKIDEKLEFPEKDLEIKREEMEKYLKDKSKSEKICLEIMEDEKKKYEKIQANLNPANESHQELVFKERANKKTTETEVEKELKRVYFMKHNYQKNKIIEESKKLIDSFDKQLHDLRRKKCVVEYKQKLGELELLLKHEEYNILRSFESEDNALLKRLEDLFNNYKVSQHNLKNSQEDILNNEEEKSRFENERELKIKEFFNLIQSEKEAKDKLTKIFFTRTKKAEAQNDQNGDQVDDDNIDNLDDKPKSIQPGTFKEILELRERREEIDTNIDTLKKKIDQMKNTKKTLIEGKKNDDGKLRDIRDKINQNERNKSKFLNKIDFAVALKLDQFMKFESTPDSRLASMQLLSNDISKAILITKKKINQLKSETQVIIQQNQDHEEEKEKFEEEKSKLQKSIRDLENEKNILTSTFVEEQILKFGTTINFDFLLKAAKDLTSEKLELEYKAAKRKADLEMDEEKEKISAAKQELQLYINENTNLLEDIKNLLRTNKDNDTKLEEKNKEINTKSKKKYEMYDIPQKKAKLKEILKLLEQQMEALKKEIDIFRRKGGHIYSTITSNLN